MDYFKETNWSSPAANNGRQWLYQTCSAFGWYQTSNSKNQPFGSNFPAELWLNYCQDIFGEEY